MIEFDNTAVLSIWQPYFFYNHLFYNIEVSLICFNKKDSATKIYIKTTSFGVISFTLVTFVNLNSFFIKVSETSKDRKSQIQDGDELIIDHVMPGLVMLHHQFNNIDLEANIVGRAFTEYLPSKFNSHAVAFPTGP